MKTTIENPISTASFDFKNKPVRTVAQQDGSTWFVARDICEALGLVWKGSVSLNSIPEEWKGVRSFRTPSSPDSRGGGEQQLVIINEPALYKLAFRSNKPEAEEFTNWVASEVLPAIRQTGQFSADPGIRITAEPCLNLETPSPMPVTEQQRTLARGMIREVNSMVQQLNRISAAQQNLVLGVANTLRIMSALNPDVSLANIEAGLLRDEKAREAQV